MSVKEPLDAPTGGGAAISAGSVDRRVVDAPPAPQKTSRWRHAIAVALPPILLDFPPDAAAGWQGLFVPLGLVISVVLIVGLLRPGSRAYFSED